MVFEMCWQPTPFSGGILLEREEENSVPADAAVVLCPGFLLGGGVTSLLLLLSVNN